MAKKIELSGKVRVNTYAIMDRAVEEGIQIGWNRAHKHVDNPTSESLKDYIQDSVMSAITEYFVFDEVIND